MAAKKFPKIVTLNTRKITVKLTKIVVGPKGRARGSAKTARIITNVDHQCSEDPVPAVPDQPTKPLEQAVDEEIEDVDLPPKKPKGPSRVSCFCVTGHTQTLIWSIPGHTDAPSVS